MTQAGVQAPAGRQEGIVLILSSHLNSSGYMMRMVKAERGQAADCPTGERTQRQTVL